LRTERKATLHLTYDCIPCAIGSLVTLYNKGLVPEDKQKPAMRALLAYLSQLDFKQSLPQMGKGMHRLSSGDDAPGTILETAPPEFRDIFDRADLVIPKGQGNYGRLCGLDKNPYFVLLAKCDHVAAHLSVQKGDFVVATT